MSATIDTPTATGAVIDSITSACDRIAPTWPLDQFIAVNPYWGWRGSSAPVAAATLGALGGTTLTMPRSWFRQEWAAGRLHDEHLDAAAEAAGDPGLADTARVVLRQPADLPADHGQPFIPRLALATDVRDLGPGPRRGQSWTDLVTHQISQHCAAYFDRSQASWHPDGDVDLFTGWRSQLAASLGIAWEQGRSWARARLASLPARPDAAVEQMLSALMIPVEGRDAYLTALLLSVNGWAAWCSYGRWQARLIGGDDDGIVGLLAIRLAWDWLLRFDHDGPLGTTTWTDWSQSWAGAGGLVASIANDQRVDWVLQSTLERTHQAGIVRALSDGQTGGAATPDVQAVFCIDVRSEVFRRALESVGPDVHTRGFAGFFGLPISYTPAGSDLTRPQLPGLLSPALNVTDVGSADEPRLAHQRSTALGNARRWSTFRSAPSSVFSFVEAMGLLYGPKLVKESLPHGGHPEKWEHDGLTAGDRHGLRPRMAMVDDDPEAAAGIAHRVLNAMGLVDGFAPLVLLCGHGSQTANNPHAAGLDCGACGGQTGEVNARVLADLLNSAEVRACVAALGITVPSTTWFVPALHNTTTDEVSLFDVGMVPPTHSEQVARLQRWLSVAGDRARAERASSLGLAHLSDRTDALKQAVLERANDWSQVRPEWGLAGNAAFIVAPRQRTRHLDLGGRSFLHDYDWALDTDLSVLTLIMTAPMVVTNWINLQYHASTVDNRRYGSGNKVLHNVVGGRIGVFEGNGGDLRIGLSMQSLHDGHVLRHPPLRLSVFIEAPRSGIDSIISAHTVVQELVGNAWLHLLRIEPSDGSVERWTPRGWVAA